MTYFRFISHNKKWYFHSKQIYKVNDRQNDFLPLRWNKQHHIFTLISIFVYRHYNYQGMCHYHLKREW